MEQWLYAGTSSFHGNDKIRGLWYILFCMPGLYVHKWLIFVMVMVMTMAMASTSNVAHPSVT